MTQLEVLNKNTEIQNSVSKDNENSVNTFINNLKIAQNSIEGTVDNSYYAIQDVFESQWQETLELIKNNLQSEMTSKEINRNNPEDPTVSAYTKAIKSFETDLTLYYTQRQQQRDAKKGNQPWTTDESGDLKYEFNLVQSIKKLIIDKQTAVKKEEKADAMFNTIPTPELAKQLFENSDPETYNTMIKQIVGEKTDPIEIKSVWEVWKNLSEEEALKIWNLYKRIKAYIESVNINMENISDIKIGKPSASFWWRYEKTDIQRVIQYTQTEKTDTQTEKTDKKYIIHGSYDNLQKELAIKNAKTKLTEANITELDKKTRAERLNAFDDIGNYALFNEYLKKKWSEYVKANLIGILQAINIYTPSEGSIDKKDNQLNVFKNGYATTITDYVVEYSGKLLESYTNQITENNLNIFWVDQKTRIENFNKIVNKLNDTWIWKDLPKAKQEELIKIRSKIEDGEAPGSAVEVLSKGLDGMIETFGPLLFNVLKLFGIGKVTMMKRFPTMTEKINSMFQKEYWLSSDEIWVINTISEKHKTEKSSGKHETKISTLDTAKKIKDAFVWEKTNYIDHFLDAKIYKYLNINIIKTWLKAYNKANSTNTTIDNIITVEKNKDTGKEYIASITNPDVFKASLGNIFDTDDVWSEIHNANVEIQTKNKDNATKNEHNMTEEDAKRYLIQNNEDIARYLTASLFSTKDLAYVMTENSLHNGSNIQEGNKENGETNKKTLTFINKEKYFTDGKLNAEWYKKTIHEVIDVSNSPDKLQIIRKDWTTVNIEQKKIGDILTYVEVEQQTKNVIIKTWDQIQEMPKQKTAEELALESFTNNRNKISGDDGIKKTVKEKYDAELDISSIEKIETIPTGKLKNYQENILSPLKEVMTNEKQYKLLTDKFVSGTNKTDYEALFTNPLHIANVLSVINTENTTPETNKEAITNLRAGGTFTVETDEKGLITITSQDKWTITIKQKETNGKITLDALRAPKTVQA